MIDHGQRVRLAGIVRGEVGYRHAAESYPLASDDNFRGVQCSKRQSCTINLFCYITQSLLTRTGRPDQPGGLPGARRTAELSPTRFRSPLGAYW